LVIILRESVKGKNLQGLLNVISSLTLKVKKVMIHYIIDGNNVIGKIPELVKFQKKDKQRAREQLVYLLQNYFHNKTIGLTLHFDGYENIPLRLSKGKIVYSGKKAADYFIRENVEVIKNRKNITLVTSDNELKNFGKACGCRVISSEDFVAMLNKGKTVDKEKPEIGSKSDIEEFKRLFDVK